MTLRAARTGTTAGTRVALCGLVLAGTALVAGCTSSSSDHANPTRSAAPTGSTSASGTPTDTGTPVNTGTVTPPKHVAEYRKVTAGQAKKLEPTLARAPGVQSTEYVPATRQFSVYFTPKATEKQRKLAKKIVRQTLPANTSGHNKH